MQYGADTAMSLKCLCVHVWHHVCVSEWMCTMQTPRRNDLKFGTVVVIDTVLQPTDFGVQECKG